MSRTKHNLPSLYLYLLGILSGALGFALSGCGGGGASGINEDAARDYRIALRADRTQLPVNVARLEPNVGGPYTTTLYADVRDGNGHPITAGGLVNCAVAAGLDGSGALYYLDGNPEHQVTETVNNTLVTRDRAYRAVNLDANAGVATFHFHAYDVFGAVTIQCSVTGTNGITKSASATIQVGSVGSGRVSQLVFDATPTPLVPQGQSPGTTQVRIVARLVDEAGVRIADPAAGVNNLFVEIVPDAGTAAEDTAQLRAVDALGQPVSGASVRVRSVNGHAEFTLLSGNATGPIQIRARADRTDNNVDNGITDAVWSFHRVDVVNPANLPATLIAVTTASLPDAEMRVPYGAVLQAEGGAAPYTWSIIGGNLPSGLSLSPTGILSGTPMATVSGTYSFVVRVTDAGNQSASQQLSITYTAAGVESLAPTVTTTSLPAGTVNQPYLAILAATGGTAPYTWTAVGLPAGLTLNAQGILSGTPTTAGTFPIAVTVTGENEYYSSRALTLTINP